MIRGKDCGGLLIGGEVLGKVNVFRYLGSCLDCSGSNKIINWLSPLESDNEDDSGHSRDLYTPHSGSLSISKRENWEK